MPANQEFTEAIKENEGIIYKVTFMYTDNLEDRKDLYQEIVYQLWKSFDTFKGNSKLSTWIYRVALNTSVTYLDKRKKRGQQVPINSELLNRLETSEKASDEKLKLLYEHIKRLNDIEKAIILLYLEGKNYEEIAGITGFSKTNVGTRLNRIKEKLRQQVKA
ncbi:RNA polymerase sigma factor [Salegentibacter chungangensis]|uniref:RNA polymerase sigma factor n=1 Tax=Salegentibacter chungangensis TaxID=1335724 RepID=A0ABW3NT23_9FLAO